MSNAIYIIAYHGADPETRQKRSDNHNKQIEWWLDYDKEIEIRILAMDFIESEYWDNPRVKYIDRLVSPTPPASARNILLNHFYDTNEQWAVFADSDAILNLHPNFPHTHNNICATLRDNPDSFGDVDLFCPHNDQRPGDGSFYSKFCPEGEHKLVDREGNSLVRDKDYKGVDWDNDLVFDRKLTHMKGTLFFVKNNPERLLMDEYFNVHPEGTKSILGGEDDEYMVRFVMSNKGTYMLRNVMLKEMTAGSTWSDTESRKSDEALRNDRIAHNYSLPDDRSKWTKFIKKNHTGYPRQLRINVNKKDNFSSLFD